MKILISYAPADQEWVNGLVTLLRLENFGVDLANAFPTDEKGEASLRQRIASADLVVVVVTGQALRGSWVLFSYGAARSAGKPVIPLQVSGGQEPPPVRFFEKYRWTETPQDAAEQIKQFAAEQMAGV